MMDPDYIIFRNVACNGGAAARRSAALQHWLEAKGDAEYAQALDQIEQSPQREAWRVFRHRNGRSVVQSFRVCPGERLCEEPLGVNINRWGLAQGQELGHTLLSSLATLELDDVLSSIQYRKLFFSTKIVACIKRMTRCHGIATSTLHHSNILRTGLASW